MAFSGTTDAKDAGAPLLADDGRVAAVLRGPAGGQSIAIPIWHVVKMTPSGGEGR
jgi:hypothetical protein